MAKGKKAKEKVERERMKSRKLRFKKAEESKIQTLANLYAGGNFSKWVRFAALNCDRKVLADGD